MFEKGDQVVASGLTGHGAMGLARFNGVIGVVESTLAELKSGRLAVKFEGDVFSKFVEPRFLRLATHTAGDVNDADTHTHNRDDCAVCIARGRNACANCGVVPNGSTVRLSTCTCPHPPAGVCACRCRRPACVPLSPLAHLRTH